MGILPLPLVGDRWRWNCIRVALSPSEALYAGTLGCPCRVTSSAMLQINGSTNMTPLCALCLARPETSLAPCKVIRCGRMHEKERGYSRCEFRSLVCMAPGRTGVAMAPGTMVRISTSSGGVQLQGGVQVGLGHERLKVVS